MCHKKKKFENFLTPIITFGYWPTNFLKNFEQFLCTKYESFKF